MFQHAFTWGRAAALSFFAFGLVACGGGGGGEAPPPPVAVAPSITAQPASQTVVAGSSATFAVTAGGSAPLAYQWLRNGAEVSGATQSTHTIGGTLMQDSGSKWSVRVGNAAGSVTSAEAVLTVTPAPVPLGLSMTAGSAVGVGNLDGTGRAAYFNTPGGIAFAADGSFYVADSANRMIRKVTANGTVSTIAGQPGVSGTQDGTTTVATFTFPADIVLAKDGNLYFLDGGKLRGLVQGQVITMHAPVPLRALATTPDGTLYGASATSVWALTPFPAILCEVVMCASGGTLVAGLEGANANVDGTATDARFFEIGDLAVDASRNIYVSQPRTHTLRKITAANVVTTFAGSISALGSVDGTGSAARFSSPRELALDAAGNLWVTEAGSGKFRKVSPAGQVTTPYGSQAFFSLSQNTPIPIVVGPSGELYFSVGKGVSRINAAGTITPIAGQDFAVDPAVGTGGLLDATGTPVVDAGVGLVAGLAIDPSGNIVIADLVQGLQGAVGPIRLSKFTSAGEHLPFSASISLLSTAFTGYGQAYPGVGADAQGNVYVAVVSSASTGLNFVVPKGGTISKVTPDGTVSVVASWPDGSAGAMAPAFMTVGRDGALYFIDLITGNVVKWTVGVGPTTLANVGSVGNLFSLSPWVLAADASGTVYVMKNRVVQKAQNGGLVTIAGAPGEFGGMDGPGTQARFVSLSAAATDAAGNLFIADREVVRKMTAQGVVSTVAGQRNSFGLRTGPLPGSLGTVGPMAIGPNGILHLVSDQALVKVRFE